MTDLANLGIRVESQEAEVADKRLDDLALSAANAEKSVDGLAMAARRADGATSTMSVAVREQSRILNTSRNAMGLTAAEGLNLSRQFADIGVTAAMGMNPLMIAIQQGPQLIDIFAMSAARAGTTIRTAMLTAATGVYALMAPFLPLIAAVAAAAAVIGGGLALAARGANKEFSDLEKGLGLTDEQLKKVKDSSIGMGDIVVATFQEVGEAILDAFDGPIKSAQKATTSFLDELTANTIREVKVIVGAFVGGYEVVRGTWRLLPRAIGDAAVTAANAAISAINNLMGKAVDGINDLREQYNSLPSWMRGGQEAPILRAPRIATMGNQFAGGMEALGGASQTLWNGGMARGAQIVDNGTGAVGRRAAANEIAGIKKQAGDDDGNEAARTAARIAKEAKGAVEEMDALGRVTLRPLGVELIRVYDELLLIADRLQVIDDMANQTAAGLTSAFGQVGQSIGDLLTIMTAYGVEMNRLDQLAATGRNVDRDRAFAQIQNYGDLAAAAKGFFATNSDGYRALQGVEAAYRAFQFAMTLQAMGQDAAETASSVANSGVRAAASAGAGAAKMFEALGPYAFPVVAAMLALLASLGMKGKGGGGGGSSKSVDASVTTSQGLNQQADQAKSSFVGSVAQKVEVIVTADRNGMNAYVVGVAADTARPMVAQGMAAASGATRAQVMADLDKGRTYSRGNG